MEGNRDEAEKCVEIAREALNAGNRDKAQRFLQKAEKLYPLPAARGETPVPPLPLPAPPRPPPPDPGLASSPRAPSAPPACGSSVPVRFRKRPSIPHPPRADLSDSVLAEWGFVYFIWGANYMTLTLRILTSE
jgi:DnaJ family protein B protein 14